MLAKSVPFPIGLWARVVHNVYTRYVEGLGTWAPEDPADYAESGERLAKHGYAKFDFSKIRGEWPEEGR